MISLQKVDNAIKFTFTDSQHYLYGDGVIAVPVNSLLLVEDKSNAVTFKKIDGDVFVSAPVAEFGMSKSEIEAFYKENMVGSTGGGGSGGTGISSAQCQTLIDESISGKADTSAVTAVNDSLTAHTNNSNIHVTAGDKLYWDGKSDFSGSYNDLTDKPTIPTVPTSNTAFTNDAGYITSGDAQSQIDSSISGKQDTLSAGTGISISGNVISATGGGGGANAIEVTQAEYDALVSAGTVDLTAFYIITDAPAIDLSGYAQTSAVTAEITAAVSGKADTSAVTASINAAVSGKVDTSSIVTAVTSGSTDSEIPTAKAVYDAIPTGGTSITIDPTLDSGSKNPVANSAITNGINSRLLNVYYGDANYAGQGVKILQKTFNGSSSTGWGYLSSINNKSIIDTDYTRVNKFSLVETSAITSAVTSASTDSQIPTAKAVYDAIPTGGTGGSYTAGEGISIENDEISTSYSGYPFNGEVTNELYGFDGTFYILCPYDCEGSTDGVASFEVNGHSYQITFYPETQTFDDGGDGGWMNYFDILWDYDEEKFKIVTKEPIDAIDGGCVRFLTSEIRYSGTTTDGINGALEVATKVDKQLGGLKFVRLTQTEYDNLSVKDNSTLYIIADVPSYKWLATYTGGTTDSASCDSTSAITYTEITKTDLESIIIGDCVTELGDDALSGSQSLTSATISDGVTTIGNSVFNDCPNLVEVTIGSGVTSMGSYVFTNTNGSFTLTILATTPPTLTEEIFDQPNGGIFVPAEAVQDYQNANIWSNYAQGIQPIQ